MAWLSPQQRKIIEFLCDRRHAVAVKEIARHCFITHQTASSQFKDPREKGYVHAITMGRESCYELHEPLIRFCLEVKSSGANPFVYSWTFCGCGLPRLDCWTVDLAPTELCVRARDALRASRYVEDEDPRIAA